LGISVVETYLFVSASMKKIGFNRYDSMIKC
jgi:hypothetical protein